MHVDYAVHMRTTISLDDRLARLVRRKAAERRISVSAFIAEVLDDAVKRREPERSRPFQLVTAGGGGPIDGIDLDRARGLVLADDEDAFKR